MTDRIIMWFRRDLRLADNTALRLAARHGKVIPVFIYCDTLLQRWSAAPRRLAFMAESLASLDGAIADAGGELLYRQGPPLAVLRELIAETGATGLAFNRDYTPFARRRDREVYRALRDEGITLEVGDDAMLQSPEAVLKGNGEPYSVFTPYYKSSRRLPVAAPASEEAVTWATGLVRGEQPSLPAAEDSILRGGREAALAALAEAADLAGYDETRDLPARKGTTRLAAHLRFGTLSIREAHAAISRDVPNPEPLLRQLYWRDFYQQISYRFPHVFSGAFRRQYDAIAWNEPGPELARWQAGETGFPIVDAGMRELAATGWMHNRVRMITASFLVKNLHIDWRVGEQHFARHLIDYDPSSNNGNWQWCASTGCDAQPYFRVFNPWRQQARFDPDCHYIKQWVPELRDYPARQIHSLEKHDDFYLPKIVDLKDSAAEIKARFKSVRSDA